MKTFAISSPIGFWIIRVKTVLFYPFCQFLDSFPLILLLVGPLISCFAAWLGFTRPNAAQAFQSRSRCEMKKRNGWYRSVNLFQFNLSVRLQHCRKRLWANFYLLTLSGSTSGLHFHLEESYSESHFGSIHVHKALQIALTMLQDVTARVTRCSSEKDTWFILLEVALTVITPR